MDSSVFRSFFKISFNLIIHFNIIILQGLLNKTDWNLICLDRLDFSGNLNRIADMLKDKASSVRRRLKYVWVDLRSPITEAAASDIGKVDYILHLAAGSHVDRSIEYPMEFVWDNVVGTVNLLEFARKFQPNLDRFVYFSTDEVFGPAPRGKPPTNNLYSLDINLFHLRSLLRRV